MCRNRKAEILLIQKENHKKLNMKSTLVTKIVQAEKLTVEELFTTKGKIYTFLNPVSYLSALDHKELFSHFDGIFADGSLLVSAIKIVYGMTVTRRSLDMTSLAPLLLGYAEREEKTIYVVASKHEQVEKAVEVFRERYPRIRIIGYRNGYFSSEEEQEVEAKHIAELTPDFVIVGMGILAQERFLLKMKDAGFKGIGFTCGGFIHQTAKNEIDYYPAWVDKTNIRFIYRMYKEKHTRRRYLQAAILFPARFLWERIMG